MGKNRFQSKVPKKFHSIQKISDGGSDLRGEKNPRRIDRNFDSHRSVVAWRRAREPRVEGSLAEGIWIFCAGAVLGLMFMTWKIAVVEGPESVNAMAFCTATAVGTALLRKTCPWLGENHQNPAPLNTLKPKQV